MKKIKNVWHKTWSWVKPFLTPRMLPIILVVWCITNGIWYIVILEKEITYSIIDGKKVPFYKLVVIEKEKFDDGKLDYSGETTYILKIEKNILSGFFYIGEELEVKRSELTEV